MSKLAGLYAITVDGVQGDTLYSQVEAALSGGARILQYRDKSTDNQRRLNEALQLLTLCRQHQATFIINDDIDLCLQCGAHGVHLGKNDTHYSSARNRLGADRIIGVSCYNDLQLAQAATRDGADYVAFGAIYPSTTKPLTVAAGLTLLREAKRQLSLPVVAIGGLDETNIAAVAAIGVPAVAVIRAILQAEDPAAKTATLNSLLQTK